MAAYAPTYQQHLDDVLAYFNGKRMLYRKDVAEYLGKSVDYCRDHLKIGGDGITAVKLADMLSRMDAKCK